MRLLPVWLWILCGLLICCKARKPKNELKGNTDVQIEALINRLDYVGFEEGSSLSEDQRNGLRRLFAGDGFKFRLPVKLLRKTNSYLELDHANQWRVFGLLPSPNSRSVGDPKKVIGLGNSYFTDDFEPKGEFVNYNCFHCHAGVVNGTVYAGLGNAHIDQAAEYASLKLALSLGHLVDTRNSNYLKKLAQKAARTVVLRNNNLTENEIDAYHEVADFMNTMVLPVYKHARARGENYGPFPVWVHLTRFKDPSQSGFEVLPASDSPSKEFSNLIEKDLPPVDPLPWWLRKYRDYSYWYSDSSTDPDKAGKDFAVNFTVPHVGVNQTYKDRSKITRDILDYALQVKSPAMPSQFFAENHQEKIEKGLKIYRETKCASCHGDYAPGTIKLYKLNYKAQGLGRRLHDVGTDLAYSNVLRSFKPLADNFSKVTEYLVRQDFKPNEIPQLTIPATSGYTAPPLVGIWASAPYLHNGSIPTLADFLSRSRPTYWRRSIDPFAYDMKHVGLKFEPLQALPAGNAATVLDIFSPDGVKSRAVFNTTIYGRSNQGHLMGTDLDAESKADLIEFLKSLNDETVEPG
jgi:hypothetical protein